jgi:predicted N-acetyltransferase YhbS
LIESGLAAARAAGHDCIMLVGDLAYYGRFGFSNARTAQWQMPGPVDQSRVLALSLSGLVLPAGPLKVCGPAQQAALQNPGEQDRADQQAHR